MSEPAREARALALIEAEFRADDPRLIALFDAFDRDGLILSAPRQGAAVMAQWKVLARSFLALLLVPLTIMTVLAALSASRGAPTGLGRRADTAVEMWAVRQGQAISAQICRSIPLPAAAACQ
jgi:hypothetical protein